MKNKLFIVIVVIATIFMVSLLAGSATYTTEKFKDTGTTSVIKKRVITITPAEPNSETESFVDTEKIAGELKRIVVTGDGNDTAFKCYLIDSDGVTLWSKTDCNGLELPYSYALSEDTTGGDPSNGIPYIGVLRFDVNDVNMVLQTEIKLSVYYKDERY